MIDEKTILQWELDAEEAGLKQHAEIIRLARRYLALREDAVANVVEADEYRDSFDAVADRLLESGE